MAKNRKIARRSRVRRGIRERINGTRTCPRFSVFRSNKHIYAQLVDDVAGHTVVAASSLEKESISGNPTEVSKVVGQRLAERAKEAGIENVVFDRNGYRYHGRIKALADGARTNGLQF